MSDTDRHRADDDVEALSSGGFYRTPNGDTDLLRGSSTSLNSDVSNQSKRRSSGGDPPEDGTVPPSSKPNRQARLEARLAKRTNKVMSAYKNYLAQIDDNDYKNYIPKISQAKDIEENSSNDHILTNVEVGRPPFSGDELKPYKDDVREQYEEGNPFPSISEYNDGLVQRSWTYRRENSGDPPEDTFLDYDDIRSKFGIEAEQDQYDRAGNSSYKYPLLHSRRAKRSLVFIAVTAVVIGVSVGISSTRKKTALPDWEAELAEIQKEEQKKHAQNLEIMQMSEDVDKISVVSHLSEANEAIQPPIVDAAQSNANEFTMNTIYSYKDVANKFNPVAFDRSKGWVGTTYNDAVNFCNELTNRSLCPYEAVCPLGVSSKPAGGYKTNGSWLAISDEPNGWVHLGSVDSCTRYEETYSQTPEWGMTGSETETKNIMCCEITEDSPKVAVMEEFQSVDEIKLFQDEPEIAALTDAEEENAKFISDKLQPIYYNRSHGWEGQTYSEALEFCASHESRVPCPYAAVCPNGKGRPPLGGVQDGVNNNDNFVPIIDTPNQWVQLSSRGVCELHSSLYGSPPEWGLTGKNNKDITRNIVCCKEPEESFRDTVEPTEDTTQEDGVYVTSKAESLESSSSEVVQEVSVATLTSAEQTVLDVMHPLWFGRKHGWQGTTWDDAVEFCKNVAGMSLCPSEAYCPNGPDVKNRPPLFLEMDAFDGEQWAATSNHSNSWILVGTSDGDAMSTCKTHEQLHDSKTPSWGMDGTFTHMKENIMCCVDSSQTSTGSISKTDDSDISSEIASSASFNAVATTDNALGMEQLIHTELEPIWLGAKDGWNGGSHDDAMEFCQNFRGKQLCPYAAYCPHGSGQPVLGRHRVDFNAEGVLYAPVFGNENHWVMIGQKGENSATTCMSHYQLEGSYPTWGLTDEQSEYKKYILCCTMSTHMNTSA